jgi:four helix bundle protein
VRDHRKLTAFKLADSLVITVYKATRSFPREELFGLSSQMRRASVSAAANIVEGCARQTQAEYVQFLNIALGSLRELGYYIGLSCRLEYIPERAGAQLTDQYDEAARVLSGLIGGLRRMPNRSESRREPRNPDDDPQAPESLGL